ncbi:Protein FAM150B [Oryzias melastigma]|uniref:ALK and LTK ligand 2 n=1 Tax=Oryzias melastigma TaxID=30732 RepID=A0A3B3BNI3_ORYME|nr:ALK and LTK ligand 2 [Oryzias melastigma]KAF6737533.1 Protein FAM150B [Oryzias melastigma]
MSGPRRHAIMGLLLVMCALTEHICESAPSTVSVVRGDARLDLRRMQQIMRHVEDSRGRHHSAKTEAPALAARAESSSAEQRDFRSKADKGNHSVVTFPRDLRKKEKFIKHITGPLFFSPKCRKTVYRVYHHTRDCTIPAYFKRCARLLTRLAGSPQCTEG